MAVVNSMFDVQQTCRTILFEEFCNDQEHFNLARILKDTDKSGALSGQTRRELETLYVHSFDEFLDKFAPEVYQIVWQNKVDGNFVGKPSFAYETDKAKSQGATMMHPRIDKIVYYKMLMEFYRDKGKSQQSDYKYDYSRLLKMMAPEQEVKETERLRLAMSDNYNRALFAEQRGENSTGYVEKYLDARAQAAASYDDTVSLISARMQDIDTCLLERKKHAQENDGVERIGTPVSGYIAYDDVGKLTFKKNTIVEELPQLEQSDDIKLLNSRQMQVQEIVADIEKDYGEIVPLEHQSNFSLDIVRKAYAPLSEGGNSLANISTEDLKQEKKMLQIVYKAARDAMAESLCPLIEKIIGVKAFFDHASGNSKFTPGLLIANCKASRLLEEDVREQFEVFMKNQGVDNPQIKERIWLGILPGVHIGPVPAAKSKPIDIHASIKDRMQGATQKKATASDIVDIDAAKTLLKIMDEAKIMTVCNTRLARDKEQGSDSITVDYLQKCKAELPNDLNHAIYAYPNFTLMPERNVNLEDAENADSTQLVRLHLPAAFVDAAYVSAGLIAASQQQEQLLERGFIGQVKPQNVCVHVNLDDKAIRKNLATLFNPTEGWVSAVKEEARGFGMAFQGSDTELADKTMKNAYITSARTLFFNKDKNRFRRIDRVLVADFIIAYMNFKSIDSAKEAKEFNKKIVQAWREESKYDVALPAINYVLLEDEEVKWNDSNHSVTVKFGEDEVTFAIKQADFEE